MPSTLPHDEVSNMKNIMGGALACTARRSTLQRNLDNSIGRNCTVLLRSLSPSAYAILQSAKRTRHLYPLRLNPSLKLRTAHGIPAFAAAMIISLLSIYI